MLYGKRPPVHETEYSPKVHVKVSLLAPSPTAKPFLLHESEQPDTDTAEKAICQHTTQKAKQSFKL
uniref:Uncharacterized protein n=1 Tax=Thermosporothrix sp. COM3 TaxID=2490863 RepID=A0A455SIB5_9CHLR|nr:hypothetical protein KTC_06560 [Thermosporothrix sp. COM3]